MVLFLAAFAAAAAEVPFTAPVYGPAPANQLDAAVASDGSDYLVVWTDQRSVPNEAYATRVTRDGVVLDPTGIRIPAKNVYDAQVVWTGTSYLVVWQEPMGRLASARINREGRLVQEPRTLLEDAQLPRVIQAGDVTVIGHLSGTTFPPAPRAAFLDESGNVIARVTLGPAGVHVGAARVAWNGSQLIGVWINGGLTSSAIVVQGVRFDRSGPLETPRTLLGAGYNADPAIASDGRDFALLTRDYDTSAHRATRIAADLTPGETFTLPSEIAANATLLWAGTEYVAVGEYGVNVSAQRLDRDARPVGTIQTVESTSSPLAPASAAVANGSEVFVAWTESEDLLRPFESLDIYGAILGAPALQRRATALLSVAARRQSNPLVAAGPSNLLTVWNESDGVYARRTGFDGNPLDEAPLRLGPPAQSAVVFNGTDFVVASVESVPQQIVTRRIPAVGTLAATVGSILPLTAYVGSIALATDAGETLLVWNTAEHVLASRVTADGLLRDAVPLAIAAGILGEVAAAGSDGGGFLVTWTTGEIVCCHGSGVPVLIAGARVTPELTSLDAGGFVIANTNALESDPGVTWNGREWLVTYFRDAGADSDVRARRVTRAGTPLDGGVEDAGWRIASRAWGLRVVWDGSRYAAAWFDLLRPDQPLRIHSAWISAAGEVSPDRILGEAEAYANAGLVALAPVANGRVATAYARIGREPVYGGVSRAFVQPMTFSIRRRSVR